MKLMILWVNKVRQYLIVIIATKKIKQGNMIESGKV